MGKRVCIFTLARRRKGKRCTGGPEFGWVILGSFKYSLLEVAFIFGRNLFGEKPSDCMVRKLSSLSRA